jgi:hypothetical protein
MENIIPYEEAKKLIERYRQNWQNIPTSGYANSLSLSETFSAEAFRKLLDQPGCVGVRIYYGMKEDLKICAILVGVDVQDRDMVGVLKGGEDEVIIEDGKFCPPFCPVSGF